jgi:hypothetical protein
MAIVTAEIRVSCEKVRHCKLELPENFVLQEVTMKRTAASEACPASK